jgi:hypothetical protein
MRSMFALSVVYRRLTQYHACKLGAEGIVSKRLGHATDLGRSPDWLKFKNPLAPAVKRGGGRGLGAVTGCRSFKTPSHNRCIALPGFASSMIFRATAARTRSATEEILERPARGMTGKGTGGSDAFLLGTQECKSVVSALGSEVIPAAVYSEKR